MGAFLLDLLKVLGGLVIGAVIGFLIARKYMKKYIKKKSKASKSNDEINEQVYGLRSIYLFFVGDDYETHNWYYFKKK